MQNPFETRGWNAALPTFICGYRLSGTAHGARKFGLAPMQRMSARRNLQADAMGYIEFKQSGCGEHCEALPIHEATLFMIRF
ncbi:hypothetical protein [Bradyrhizobium sp. BRP22]|uniref:hypothetical protein n=1 Tax=Bradyrhizobium sp. BRP22 TaxID=2793821 RepID=UPI00201BCDAE|nr:hypothetical protein [Bradyrhizobium sp. BRP22]